MTAALRGDETSSRLIPEHKTGVKLTNITFAQLNAKYRNGIDGHYTPQGCAGRDKTAIIIPFRDRHQNLTVLINNLIPILKYRNKDFTIFVIEQDLDTTFNKAILMNAGFMEAMKQDYFTCFIFHDVDYIPETQNVPYECLLNRSYHLAAAVSAFNYTDRLKFAGGVMTMAPHLFQAINGYSNLYFGWGFEDNDMYRRQRLYWKGIERAGYDGLNSLKYTVVKTTTMPICTWKRISFNASYYV
ncbi:beta-N-acetyl-D-glucosaminide beta-1,4-N-acetylglucosaminyl-transferase-like [Haliotis rubra]|uniref:beta-N-acetyl-D-glucosaminide beta-1,4-N-acetylglucosaminyl-transferase-like n=1 Tax=Haliotis rubra TaxID=36100 RepID=UPI001EE5243F|nr:beta-N-acetyl-D-glucosaminide beta-1,4-N-acetylglucosaminyl-transferase-like [Haliotis rubra]